MNALSKTDLKTDFSIHPATLMGHVSLTVANLENQLVSSREFLHYRNRTTRKSSNRRGLEESTASVPLPAP